MMRLRAAVQNVSGKTKHLLGQWNSDKLEVTTVPSPTIVELVEEDGSFYLLRIDDAGGCIADTWHETAEAAKAQANFEFGIDEGDWRKVEG